MPNCAVKDCKSWKMRRQLPFAVRYFSFPRNEEVRKLWIKACNKPALNSHNARMCSLHFTDDDWCLKDRLLNTDRSKCVLDKNAVPSRNISVEMPKPSSNEPNKTLYDDRVKPKNVLALNEKVAAIRRYQVDPVYKSVGRYFNCSPDQIKRIIKLKDEILSEWDNRTKKTKINLSSEMKTVKISFLGKAVHEWIRRMMYYSDFKLTDALIQTMAIEFKKALNLPNFFPDKAWIASFRNTYNLKDVSTKTLGIGYQESQSVQIRDILRYLQGICGSSETEGHEFPAHDQAPNRAPNDNRCDNLSARDNKCMKPSSSKSVDYSRMPSTSTAAMSGTSRTQPEVYNLEEEDVKVDMAVKMETDDGIMTHEQALQCVRRLEEFALLKENFRLIGLVERLEEALKEER